MKRITVFLVTFLISFGVLAQVNLWNLTDTWNNAGVTFDAIKMDVTDTASQAGSKIINLQVGSVEKFAVDKNGDITGSRVNIGGSDNYTLVNNTVYGMLYVNENTTAEPLTDTTPRKLTAFSTAGPSNGVTADPATGNDLEALVSGVYLVNAHMSFKGSANATYRVAIYKNTSPTGFELHRKLSGSDLGAASVGGIVSLAANDTISLYHWSPDTGNTFIADDIQLLITRLSN